MAGAIVVFWGDNDMAIERLGTCQECGKAVPYDLLDAKPGSGHWTNGQLFDAAYDGAQFDRLECKDCYGPNWSPL
jgi:hypothetical protein